jgi:methionine-gamma-lyase
MMSFGYNPEWSEGSIKPPIFQTSTFVFKSAAEGKEFFSYAYGLAERDPARPMGLIYSRLNNPNLEILEERLNLWDRAEESAVFASGMAAISTSTLAVIPPGSGVAYARPIYGGSDYFFAHVLPGLGISTRSFPAGSEPEQVEPLLQELERAGTPCRLLFIETPANPTNVLTDIAGMATLARRYGALCGVDNTLLGPLYQQPLRFGADLVFYSATKYLGGHSDLVAGVALGSKELVDRIKMLRTILGSMLDPHSAWLLLRSLETAKLRITCARKNAEKVAAFLHGHPKISRVNYPGLLTAGRQHDIYRAQCSGGGALISFELRDGDEAAVFRLLDGVEMIQLAVSLGANESLIEHPTTMTHSDVPAEEQAAMGVTPALVRLSVGIEHPDDLIRDLTQALDRV